MHRAQSLGLDLEERDCKQITKQIKDSADRGEMRRKDVDQMLQRLGREQAV